MLEGNELSSSKITGQYHTKQKTKTSLKKRELKSDFLMQSLKSWKFGFQFEF